MSIAITNVDNESILVVDSDTEIEYSIRKKYLTTSVSGDFISLFWHRYETSVNRDYLTIDYNDITSFTSVSATDAENRIKSMYLVDVPLVTAFTEIPSVLGSSQLDLSSDNLYRKYLINGSTPNTIDQLINTPDGYDFYIYNGEKDIVILLAGAVAGIPAEDFIYGDSSFSTVIIMSANSGSFIKCRQITVLTVRIIQVLSTHIII